MMRYSIIILIFTLLYCECDNNEVEIWEICYSIENTIFLNNPNTSASEFPISICELINLETLDLDVMFGDTNFLVGEIPACIGNLENLTHLNLGWNTLEGEIPESLGNLQNLTYFSVLSNLLSGTIPESIGNLNNLTYLNLGFNYFDGNIPESIGNLSQLTELYFSQNQYCWY